MLVLLGGYFLDLLLGDPQNFPHPVRFIGKLISSLETYLYNEKSEKAQLLMGVILTVIVVATSYITTYIIIKAAYTLHFALGIIITIAFSYTVLATKSLGDEGKKMLQALQNNDIVKARHQLSYIVSRDTNSLTKEEIVRGTVETIAENISDGIIAPMFYLTIGGAPLAMAYKAINTLDSMVGYKNSRYLYFGKASAILDDIVNYIPARLSVLFIAIGGLLTGESYIDSLKMAKTQGRNHSSPNSGYPEAAVAGALMIQLGGPSKYFGKIIDKPTIGIRIKPLEPHVILKTIKLMYAASFVGLVFFYCIGKFVNRFYAIGGF
ncbi:adenosylcobinamide-phosphate synthase CbiB [Alkaliphilus peptidifermentans]|uniref:Cobalamin biosynthesis protein CobD n=1 Tax=Alkaliphilus peptidifermentans DSM 18978 TaxID=1120976 RepID=A0A1G5K1U6_9FIRM|nr:adenosylcobinamide-phosphate synthase CbiB [Alkaliphilus peptidifermentans]SCY94642.1 adenosylcobinamide-phosphate synthase [Alkaliphilus peptidifermentans DSM 18978]